MHGQLNKELYRIYINEYDDTAKSIKYLGENKQKPIFQTVKTLTPYKSYLKKGNVVQSDKFYAVPKDTVHSITKIITSLCEKCKCSFDYNGDKLCDQCKYSKKCPRYYPSFSGKDSDIFMNKLRTKRTPNDVYDLAYTNSDRYSDCIQYPCSGCNSTPGTEFRSSAVLGPT